MKDGRPSLTANLVAASRAFYTELPPPLALAEDPLAAELVPAWLALPAQAARRAPWAAGLLHRVVRAASLGLAQHIALRTRAIDDALRAAVQHGARQLVVLGAGLDSRAEHMPELADLPVFEVDHPATHRFKLERLEQRGTGARRAPTARVAIDFERDRLADVLAAAGFDRATPTFWIWEGVTVYLGVEAIAETVAAVGALSAPRSRLAVTYVTPEDDPGPAWLIPAARALASAVGEPLRGLVEERVMWTFLERSGFEVLSDEGDGAWAARYWPTEPAPRAWERLAVAERVAQPPR